KIKLAASLTIVQSSLNLTGQVITGFSLWKILQTPSGNSILFFVQFDTILLNGQSLFSLYLLALFVWLTIGKPKISDRGCLLGIVFKSRKIIFKPFKLKIIYALSRDTTKNSLYRK